MKKLLSAALILLLLVMTSCGRTAPETGQAAQEQAGTEETAASEEVIDITALSGTMLYAEVINICADPDTYTGKTIRMKGKFTVFQNRWMEEPIFACTVPDATGCCLGGFEFDLGEDHTFPDDYPEEGAEITITGTYEKHAGDGYLTCNLNDVTMEISE